MRSEPVGCLGLARRQNFNDGFPVVGAVVAADHHCYGAGLCVAHPFVCHLILPTGPVWLAWRHHNNAELAVNRKLRGAETFPLDKPTSRCHYAAHEHEHSNGSTGAN